MNKTSQIRQIFIEFLKLKKEEILYNINYSILGIVILWLTFLALLVLSSTSSSFILQFIVYYFCFLSLAVIVIAALALIFILICEFVSWIKSNWKQATYNVKQRNNVEKNY